MKNVNQEISFSVAVRYKIAKHSQAESRRELEDYKAILFYAKLIVVHGCPRKLIDMHFVNVRILSAIWESVINHLKSESCNIN